MIVVAEDLYEIQTTGDAARQKQYPHCPGCLPSAKTAMGRVGRRRTRQPNLATDRGGRAILRFFWI